ncbi:FecR family protein [Maribacter sp. 2304DJ31-5]|uniref:FecR family protein n=1 Tax=Maribacter sp. 2304DJ31-5 TaxID=3386273 RepID=UPI0039BCDA79
MNPKEIEHLIIKFVNKSANANELDLLKDHIKDPKSRTVVNDYIKLHFAITVAMNESSAEDIKKRFLKEIRKEKIYRLRLPSILKYAAIILVSLSLGYIYYSNYGQSDIIIPKEEEITLELGDGTIRTLSKDENFELTVDKGQVAGVKGGKQLVYTKAGQDELIYNTLCVPYGKRFSVQLSDGTLVDLNSGSSLKYPIGFLENRSRQVFLEGEGFFRVTKNESVPFLVHANELRVEVLGTSFNVGAYVEDRTVDVILTEGSVMLYDESSETGKTYLKPGTRGRYHRSEGSIATEQVSTAIYTSWVKGTAVFRNASFDNIIKKLERFYNVTIINQNQELSKETFNANIDVEKESIEEVLTYFNTIYNIEYQIHNNKIIIR